jgi:hypothetical protein
MLAHPYRQGSGSAAKPAAEHLRLRALIMSARSPPHDGTAQPGRSSRRYGCAHGLEVVDVPLPTAGRGEVRVRVLA